LGRGFDVPVRGPLFLPPLEPPGFDPNFGLPPNPLFPPALATPPNFRSPPPTLFFSPNFGLPPNPGLPPGFLSPAGRGRSLPSARRNGPFSAGPRSPFSRFRNGFVGRGRTT